jgi:ABC-2 type transport system permease protein
MLRKYLALFRANWAGVIEYRASILIYMLSATSPLVSLAVWLSLAADGPVGNYSATDFVAYYLAVIFVRQLTGAWVVYDLDFHIRQGSLSAKLLKPINPIHDFIAVNLADKLFRLPLVLTPVVIAAVLVPGVRYDLSPLNLVYFVVSLALAWLSIYFAQFCIGLLGFWISHSLAVNDLWFGIRMMLSGNLAPLDLFPAPIPQLSVYLPFRYTLSFPVEILLGRVSGDQLWLGFAVQGVWLLATFGLYRVLWTRGLRQYSAFGA